MPGPSSMGGSTGRKSASEALSADFGDGRAMENMRKRIATRKAKEQEKKQVLVAEGANKSQSTRGGSSKDAKKATTDEQGRKLTRLVDRALHDISGETEDVAEPKGSDCAWHWRLQKFTNPVPWWLRRPSSWKGWPIPMALGPEGREALLTGWYECFTGWSTLTMDS